MTVYANLSVGDKAQAQLWLLSKAYGVSKAEVVRTLLNAAVKELSPEQKKFLETLSTRANQ